MLPVLYRYGAAVARKILSTGVTVNVWNLGNEIEPGLAGVAIRGLVVQTARWTHSPPDAVDSAIGQMGFTTLITEDRRAKDREQPVDTCPGHPR